LNAEGTITIREYGSVEAKTAHPLHGKYGADIEMFADGIVVMGGIESGQANHRNHGGRIWLASRGDVLLGETGLISLPATNINDLYGIGGSLRIDGEQVTIRGTIRAANGAQHPDYGGRVSIVARKQDTADSTESTGTSVPPDPASHDFAIWVDGEIQVGGDAVGGDVSLVALGSIWVNASINAGTGTNGSVSIQSRDGNVFIGGEHESANSSATPADTADRAVSGFKIDGCKIVFGEILSLESAGGSIVLQARSTDDSPSPHPWFVSGDSARELLSPVIRFVYGDISLEPNAEDKERFWSGEETIDFEVDDTLGRCGTFDVFDMDGDTHAWERFNSGVCADSDGESFCDCRDDDPDIHPAKAEPSAPDGIDQNCFCDDTSPDLVHAYAKFTHRYGDEVLEACDGEESPMAGDADGGPGDADGGPGDADGGPEEEEVEPADDTGEASDETGSDPDPNDVDTGLPASTPFEGTAVKGCHCASTNSRPWPWFGALLAFGLIVRRRR
jgi:MYXO-CTERM domain-containing protein